MVDSRYCPCVEGLPIELRLCRGDHACGSFCQGSVGARPREVTAVNKGTAAILIGVAAVLAVVTACTTGSESAPDGGQMSAAAATPFSSQDVLYAQGMAAYQEQMTAMTMWVPSYSNGKKVQALALQLQSGQTRDAGTLQALLADRGADRTSRAGYMQERGSDSPLQGLITDDQKLQLQNLRGEAFAIGWLKLMIRGHQWAAVLCDTELASGLSPQAKAAAQSIAGRLGIEITQMRSLLRVLTSDEQARR